MTWFNWFSIGFGVLSVIIILCIALSTKKFLKTLGFSALMGIATLFLLHFTASFTGFSLEITPCTLATSGLFGLPGVVGMTLAKMIFGM